LDTICAFAEQYGLASKLTGAGGGGNAFILLPPSADFSIANTLLARGGGKSADFEQLFGPGLQWT
jgi:mevalonate kinase